ncbi:DUF3987 domain-containing protein [Amaricoccus solimangrovi]|uniref:DUF3987 domain-containing protein n=1 Tax=Amaricoccus solimangrovi TaxID=2589815 RepID=A0A501WFA2_9RHOB|nr:DUF3987 domain-containing protein [Amaricoccus solimangrovi]TPE47165.1 DUF3987 domain-containing protein [Amaricoccus solimangrovi]
MSTTISTSWPTPDFDLLASETLPAPSLPLSELFAPRLGDWIGGTATAASVPADYIVAAVLATVGSIIGNARWVSPRRGWAEPPIIWAVTIGAPSAGKSPAIGAVLGPLRTMQMELESACASARAQWTEKAALAKLADEEWKKAARNALQGDASPPKRSTLADPGPEPYARCLFVNDATIEHLAVLLRRQTHSVLAYRDELAGWLQGMTRYANGGTDRPFWLEAYGGGAYSAERMGRPSTLVTRLSVGVLGGIQPDPLKRLLTRGGDEDGLLARFLPFWPDPAPMEALQDAPATAILTKMLRRLMALQPEPNQGDTAPRYVGFDAQALCQLEQFRRDVRAREGEVDGRTQAFLGKFPGMAIRLSLILGFADWAIGDGSEPSEIRGEHFDRAAHFLMTYALPMAKRTYGDAALSDTDRAARALLALIRRRAWRRFSSRDVCRERLRGLSKATSEVNPALSLLEEAGWIRAVPDLRKGSGRRRRDYEVNPMLPMGANHFG